MRWHEKNKTTKKQQKQKTPKKTKQQHPTTRPRTKQTKQKQKQDKKEKQTQETQKHLNLPTQMNNNEPPQKNPPKLGKTSIFNTFETIPETPKTNLLILKPQKNKPPKHHFAMFKNNPLFFINFLFFQHTVFVFEKLCFAENTIKIVLSGNTAFQKHS